MHRLHARRELMSGLKDQNDQIAKERQLVGSIATEPPRGRHSHGLQVLWPAALTCRSWHHLIGGDRSGPGLLLAGTFAIFLSLGRVPWGCSLTEALGGIWLQCEQRWSAQQAANGGHAPDREALCNQ